MTVAVWVKVFDGIVLSTDSATTLAHPVGEQVYNNADKIFNLHRALPVAAMTWGLGHIGPASISTLSKTLRLRLMGRDPGYVTWKIDINDYTVEQIALKAAELFATAAGEAALSELPGEMGYLVAGYSAGSDQAEAWLLKFHGTTLHPTPTIELDTNETGFRAYAKPAAVERLFNGYDARLEAALKSKIDESSHPEIAKILSTQAVDPVPAGMPLPDAIALARFMVEITAGFARFKLGPDTVGGPVEVASINLHEGFRWIARKHYFTAELNQGEPS
ncbi:hypothetical protein F3087_07235 [Nocardia colli]|uniref:Uncharacterized protein n=1 Tax=Nocardia colli TaxID=2545717 RepID=A0A5N0EIZ8_9NOCA|nr:hypothetical protein [Nocardia colli]KAA8888800.1 hypothetical protein F3087_07235 [Nocardia colli]